MNKVIITSASTKNYWYANAIGQVFEVEGKQGRWIKIKIKEQFPFIRIEDCRVATDLEELLHKLRIEIKTISEPEIRKLHTEKHIEEYWDRLTKKKRKILASEIKMSHFYTDFLYKDLPNIERITLNLYFKME